MTASLYLLCSCMGSNSLFTSHGQMLLCLHENEKKLRELAGGWMGESTKEQMVGIGNALARNHWALWFRGLILIGPFHLKGPAPSPYSCVGPRSSHHIRPKDNQTKMPGCQQGAGTNDPVVPTGSGGPLHHASIDGIIHKPAHRCIVLLLLASIDSPNVSKKRFLNSRTSRMGLTSLCVW